MSAAIPDPPVSVVCIGEGMIELSRRAAGGWAMASAGDTLNTARYLARLGIDTAYLTALSDDPFSAEMLRDWTADGLNTDMVLTNPASLPGLYAIRTDEAGERAFFYWRGQSAVRQLFDLPGITAAFEKAATASLLYLSGITLSLFTEGEHDRLVELARIVRSTGGLVAFDPNYRPRGWNDAGAARAAIDRIAPYVSIALPTFEDEAALYGDRDDAATVQRWVACGAAEVVVKIGARGCIVYDGGDTTPVPPPEAVAAIDTTGAGDGFNAGYLSRRLSGRAPLDAARAGNRLAGEIVRHAGAMIPIERMPK